jgi:hypothetical protein
MSIALLNEPNHTHGLKDDLESLLYVVLYATLRWLPVETLGIPDLHWWLANFFGAPDSAGLGGGGDAKAINAWRRKYTQPLRSVGGTQVVQWLNDAMNLHYKDGAPNPAWDDGEALKEMWEQVLEGDLPLKDRCVNDVDGVKISEEHSLHATHIMSTPSTVLDPQCLDELSRPSKSAPIKRSQDADNDTTPPSPKRSRLGTV